MGKAERFALGPWPTRASSAGPGLALGRVSAANQPRFGVAAEVDSALDAWWRVQDLLWRLHAHHALELGATAEGRVVWLPDTKGGAGACEIQVLADPAVDRWMDGDTTRHLFTHRERTPQGVALHFASATSMARWPEGPALLDEMADFFNSLPRSTHERTSTSA